MDLKPMVSHMKLLGLNVFQNLKLIRSEKHNTEL